MIYLSFFYRLHDIFFSCLFFLPVAAAKGLLGKNSFLFLNIRPNVSFFIKITGIKGQLSGSGFMELRIFFFFSFRFCNVSFCIHRVIYLADLSAGFITKKNPKINLSRSEQAPGSEFHPRDEKEKNYGGCLGPS